MDENCTQEVSKIITRNTSNKLGRGTSWMHTFCRRIHHVTPSTNEKGSGSSMEGEREAAADGDGVSDRV